MADGALSRCLRVCSYIYMAAGAPFTQIVFTTGLGLGLRLRIYPNPYPKSADISVLRRTCGPRLEWSAKCVTFLMHYVPPVVHSCWVAAGLGPEPVLYDGVREICHWNSTAKIGCGAKSESERQWRGIRVYSSSLSWPLPHKTTLSIKRGLQFTIVNGVENTGRWQQSDQRTGIDLM